MYSPRDLENIFMFHSPKDDATKEKHEFVRNNCLDLAEALMDCCPENTPEFEQALNRLQEVMFWANAAIAREGA